ncbi:MAG: AgmX/PglI C-terminal domain-containing protein [Polyangiaceae bacterium]|nr:AgmX/PglI C-terminal domain-containing protein [Polyangiaceae bacterium]
MANPSSPPPPTSGNTKYIAILGLLVVGVGAMIGAKKCGEPPAVTPIPVPTVKPVETTIPDDIPLPVDIPDAGPETAPPKNTTAFDPCDVKVCSGNKTDDLERALAFTATKAKKCYERVLSSDNTLQGKVTVQVKIAANGNVCAATATGNDTGSAALAQCAANTFRSLHFPSPKGGCVSMEIPIKFVAGGR